MIFKYRAVDVIGVNILPIPMATVLLAGVYQGYEQHQYALAIFVAAFALSGIIAWTFLLQSTSSIVITDKGIGYRCLGIHSDFLKWSDVALIRKTTLNIGMFFPNEIIDFVPANERRRAVKFRNNIAKYDQLKNIVNDLAAQYDIPLRHVDGSTLKSMKSKEAREQVASGGVKIDRL